MWKWFGSPEENQVSFACAEEDWNVIPKPVPARDILPEWFKALPPYIDKQTKLDNSSAKRCFPLLDAFSLGWIIPLAADVEIVTNDDASNLTWRSHYHAPLIEFHSTNQITAPVGAPHPSSPKPPAKWINRWLIRMPPGYSALFVPPINRPDPRFSVYSGLVDETYMGEGAIEFVNFPFHFNIPGWTGIVTAGTPLVQLIPIKRTSITAQHTAPCAPMTSADKALLEHTRARRRSHQSLYRDELRVRK